MLANLKPGQQIRLTVKTAPRRPDDVQTIERLMREPADVRRALRRAQRRRKQTLVVRGRGGRPWAKRVESSRIVRVEAGASWTMRYYPQLAGDIAAVSRLLEIAPA